MRLKNTPILYIISVTFLLLPLMGQAQYRTAVPSIPGLNSRSATGAPSFLGMDLSKINFQHSYSMQVSSMGGDAVAMGLLKSSFDYAINPQVSFRGSVGLMHSPFSTFAPMNQQSVFMNGFNADNIYYSGEITYKPKDNMSIQFGVSKMPVNAYNPYYSPTHYRRLGY